MANVVLQTAIDGVEGKHGKVRDIYDLGDSLLIAASDRLSAFDVIMTSGIPYKGQVLTQISKFWFEFLDGVVENHLISDDTKTFPSPFCCYPEQLAGRTMLVKKTKVLPVECIVRGYITGSGWKEYQREGTVCGIELPGGLKQCEKLPEVIFTPSTKAEIGEHDENIDYDTCVGLVGEEAAAYIRDKSIEIFRKASEYAASKGILLADTKFEWGEVDGKIILIDEVLTPDSSRFWPADQYEAGRDPDATRKASISSSYGTIWKRLISTSPARVWNCPRTLSKRHRLSTSRHTRS
jgi:phosphoribosylaminoimidazole-succinocarboxamide synthase